MFAKRFRFHSLYRFHRSYSSASTQFNVRVNCAPGLEPMLERELQRLEILPATLATASNTRKSVVTPSKDGMGNLSIDHATGGVEFRATQSQLFETVLQTRIADSIRVRLGGAFYAVDFSLFYSKLAKLPWHVFFPLRDPFDSVMPTVQATSSSSCALYHSVGIAERVSKYMTSLRSPWLRGQTIHDSMRETDISRPVALPAAGRVLVTGKRNRFQVSLDCAGEQLLYKRGCRNFISRSPLRESFTAAVLEAVDHDLNGTLNDYAVVDPFCGSGTVLLEACLRKAQMQQKQVLCQRLFVMQYWRNHDDTLFEEVKQKIGVVDKIDFDPSRKLIGGDEMPKATSAARRNAQELGWSKNQSELVFACQPFEKTLTNVSQLENENFVLITNLPYGLREKKPSQKLVQNLIEKLSNIKNIKAGYVLIDRNTANSLVDSVSMQQILQFKNGGVIVHLMRIK